MRALVPTADERLVEMADVAEPAARDGQVLVEVEAFSGHPLRGTRQPEPSGTIVTRPGGMSATDRHAD